MSDIRGSVEIDLESKKYSTGLSAMESATNSSTTRMNAMLASTVKSVDGLARSSQKAGSSIHGIGNAAHQLQDVAVQLQSGTKFATVFAQQGSQIASAFGPQGAILGGAIAVGAAIYTWVTNAEEANKKFEEGEKRLKAMQEAGLKSRDRAIDNDRETAKLGLGGPDNKDALALMNERFRHEDALAEIEKERLKHGDQKLYQIEKESEMRRHQAEREAIYAERQRDNVKKLRKEEEDAQQKRDADAKKSAAEREQQLNKFEQMQHSHLMDTERREKAALEKQKAEATEKDKKREQIADLDKKLQKEVAKAEIDKQAERGGEMLKDIQNKEEGISSADIRKAQNKAASDERKAIDRKLAKEDFGNLTGKARDEAREKRRAELARDIGVAKNKDKLKAEIDGDSIQKLVEEIKNLQAALIAK